MAETKPSQKPSERLMALLDDALTRSEVMELMQKIVTAVKETDKRTADEVRKLSETVTAMQERLGSDTSSTLEEMKAYVREKVDSLKDGEPGTPGENGKDADEEYIISQVLARIVMPETRDPIMDTPVELRDKLETLKDEDRLAKEAIRGIELLEQAIEELKKRPAGRVGGAKGFQLLVDGAKKLLTAQTLNIVPGSGVSVTYAYANGRNDVTISAAGGNITVLAATGDIDGVNTSYTFASEPVVVVVNGASYRNTAGVSISGTTATLDFAPQVGSDVYGIG